MAELSDLEIAKACAREMGLPENCDSDQGDYWHVAEGNGGKFYKYDPLHDDAQAMALVKKFGISIRKIDLDPVQWDAWLPLQPADGSDADLNRAICLCCASMHLANK